MKLRCPRCGHAQLYAPIKPLTPQSRRRCVYCGKSFAVIASIIEN